MFIINAPLVFQTLSGWVFALLEQRTRSKIHVLGSDYLAQLSALIPVDNIPAFLGGKSACSAVDAALLDAAAAAQPAAADTEGNADQQGT